MYLINVFVTPLCRPTYCTATMQQWTWEDVYLPALGSLCQVRQVGRWCRVVEEVANVASNHLNPLPTLAIVLPSFLLCAATEGRSHTAIRDRQAPLPTRYTYLASLSTYPSPVRPVFLISCRATPCDNEIHVHPMYQAFAASQILLISRPPIRSHPHHAHLRPASASSLAAHPSEVPLQSLCACRWSSWERQRGRRKRR